MIRAAIGILANHKCGHSSRFTRFDDQVNAPESRSHVIIADHNCALKLELEAPPGFEPGVEVLQTKKGSFFRRDLAISLRISHPEIPRDTPKYPPMVNATVNATAVFSCRVSGRSSGPVPCRA